MNTIELYGSNTSPFVRRVRVVALELGFRISLVDTAQADGQNQLRALTPIWKVPTAKIDTGSGPRLVFDSGAISSYLMAVAGPGALALWDPNDVAQRNRMSVVDGALESLVQVFYLKRERLGDDSTPFVKKQLERTASACRWLESQVQAGSLSGCDRPHLVDIALATTVEWMSFRDVYPIEQHPALVACHQALAKRPSFEQTRPGL